MPWHRCAAQLALGEERPVAHEHERIVGDGDPVSVGMVRVSEIWRFDPRSADGARRRTGKLAPGCAQSDIMDGETEAAHVSEFEREQQ